MGKRGALLCESEGTSTNLEVEAVSSIFVFFCMQVVEQISEIFFASIIDYCLTLEFAGRLQLFFLDVGMSIDCTFSPTLRFIAIFSDATGTCSAASRHSGRHYIDENKKFIHRLPNDTGLIPSEIYAETRDVHSCRA